MAVATDRELALFIGGAPANRASGEIRALTEPATGEPLAPTGARPINPFGL